MPQAGGPSYRLTPSINNGFGITSLALGIAGFCLPGVGGLGAIVFGFLGIRKSKETRTGKGLSIAGMILGAISIVFWALSWSAILGILHLGRTTHDALVVNPPRMALEQFLRDVNGNNLSGANAESGISPEQINALHDQLKDLGLVQTVDCGTFNSGNGDYFLQGVVTFEKGQMHYTAHLSDTSASSTVPYRVTSLAVSP